LKHAKRTARVFGHHGEGRVRVGNPRRLGRNGDWGRDPGQRRDD
jgi:hypothetical protein